MSTKVCSKCGVEKDRSEFYVHKSRPDGLCAHCKACMKGAHRARYDATRDTVLERMRAHYAANRAKVLEQKKAYHAEYRARHGVAPKTALRRRDHQAHLVHTLRSRLRAALKGKVKTGSAVRDLGMPIDAFLMYLNLDALDKYGIPYTGNESKFHIDHIRPLASFELQDPEQLRIAVRWDNLQVLTVKENLTKGAKYGQAH